MRTWLKVEHHLPTHPKTKRLARLWGCHPYNVSGFLIALWGYMVEYQSDGQVADVPTDELDELATPCLQRALNSPISVLDALKQVGFVDPDGHIHDWEDYTGALLARRAKDRDRKRMSRGQAKDGRGTSAPRVEQSRAEQRTTTKSKALVELRSTPAPAVEVHHKNGNGRKPATRSVEAIITHLQEVSTQTDRRLTTEATRDVQVQVVFAYWAKRLGHAKTLLDAKRQRVLERRLIENGGNLSELLYAIDGALRDDWTMGRDPKSPRKYDGIETVFRDRAQVERFAGECQPWRAGEPHPMAERYAGERAAT